MGQSEDRDAPPAWTVEREEPRGDFEIFRARAVDARSPQDGRVHRFHLADAPDGVTVLAFTAEGGLVLVEQWRLPLGRVSLETPSGIIDPGETPEEAAARELREETGYAGDPPRIIGSVALNPSWQTTRLYAAVVRGARRVGDKELDETEATRVRCFPPDEVRRKAVAGEIDSATVLAALALYDWGGNGAG